MSSSVLANEAPIEEAEGEEAECEDCHSDNILHVYPTFGKRHDLSWDCWCRPRGEWQDGTPIWVHEIYH
jgi:hypothetical protein